MRIEKDKSGDAVVKVSKDEALCLIAYLATALSGRVPEDTGEFMLDNNRMAKVKLL